MVINFTALKIEFDHERKHILCTFKYAVQGSLLFSICLSRKEKPTTMQICKYYIVRVAETPDIFYVIK